MEKIEYTLTYKNVKNINLRIKVDGSVHVSVAPHVSRKKIDDFVNSKADFIEKAQKTLRLRQKAEKTAYCSEAEVEEKIRAICKAVYPYYGERGIPFPKLRFRKMVSRWGSCHAQKGILTFNLNLMYAPPSCMHYVVYHEFTHFLVQNHSTSFYEELGKVCPDWKELRKQLREVNIR